MTRYAVVVWLSIALSLAVCTDSDSAEVQPKVEQVQNKTFKTLEYLKSISGKKTVAGQHNREPNADPDRWTNRIHTTTGKYPGLWSGDFLFQADNIAHRQTMIDEAIKQWNNGAMINIMLHTCPPVHGEPCQWNPGIINQLLSDSQWRELVTDGTTLNTNWKSRLDTITPYLQQLKDVDVEVMFRPLHEMNQKVFWWGGRPGPEGTAKLFRITHDYLTHEKGLDNLIWVWDMQDIDRTWDQYNPGAAYWDILGFDVYSKGYSQSWYDYAVAIAGDKPLALGECSKLPSLSQLESQPRYVFFMAWAELVYTRNKEDDITTLYNSERVITRDELPLLRQ
jgi:mannan endo-1,4-beta-mannosidase